MAVQRKEQSGARVPQSPIEEPFAAVRPLPPPRAAYLFRVELLGGIKIHGPNNLPAVSRFRTKQAGELAAYMCFNRGRRFQREVLAEQFWPDVDKPRTSLNTAISSLRGIFEPNGVEPGSVFLADSQTIAIAAENVITDVAIFEETLDRAAEARETGGSDTPTVLRDMALSMWSSPVAAPLLPGFYEDWVEGAQEHLKQRWIEALLWIARRHPDRQVSCAQRILSVDSEHGIALKLLSAPSPAAGAFFEDYDLPPVRFELDSERHTASRSQVTQPFANPSQEAPPPAPPVAGNPVPPASAVSPANLALNLPLNEFFGRKTEIDDLLYRLRDPFLRLITLSGPGGAGKTRLAREMAAAANKEPQDADLPALSGAQPAPLFFGVDLTGLSDPEQLAERIASALDAPVDGDPVARIALRISEVKRDDANGDMPRRRPVLLLDNFERLLPDGAGYLENILARIPDLACVVTSRTVLGVDGEQVVPIAPLPIPPDSAAALATAGPVANQPDPLVALTRLYPSVELFVDRARRVRTGFRLTPGNVAAVVQLVRELEGMPLSIELAAARSLVMSPEQLLSSLPGNRMELLKNRGKNVHDRHRSLRETIAWSANLLSPSLCAFFASLSVFRGGWSAEAAAALAPARIEMNGEKLTPLDALEELCRTSLVRSDWVVDQEKGELTRFSFLESIREYASELLVEAECGLELSLPEARRRHAAFFRILGEQAEIHLREGNRTLWAGRLKVDHDNLLAALVWGDEEHDPAMSVEATRTVFGLTASLRAYWSMHGPLTVARELLEKSLKRRRRAWFVANDVALVRRAFNTAGILALTQQDLRPARGRLRQALLCARKDTTPAGLRARAAILNNLAVMADDAGRTAEALRWYDESLSVWKKLDNKQFQAVVLTNVALLYTNFGELEKAEADFNTAISISRDLKNIQAEGQALFGLAEIHLRRGIENGKTGETNLIEAAAQYRRSALLLYDAGDAIHCAHSIYGLALTYAMLGDESRVSWMLPAAQSILKREGLLPRQYLSGLYETWRRNSAFLDTGDQQDYVLLENPWGVLSLEEAVQRIRFEPRLGSSVLGTIAAGS